VTTNSNLRRAREYLAAIEAGATGDAVAAFFDSDLRQEEFPNRLVPDGASRDLAAVLTGAERGKAVLRSQTYEVHNAIEQGDTVALEVTWRGVLAIPIGSLQPGDEMRARFAVFLEFRDGVIRRQRNYDCFDPF
jgi:ketosteroid isomerase-like protein